VGKPAFILTGKIGAGKTTACRKVAQKAAGMGLFAGGILTPPIFDGGKKTGFYAEDLQTGERWVLGTRNFGSGIQGPVYGIYRFSIEGFKKAYGVLKSAVVSRCDLIVLDEIGPLEIVHKRGFWRILEPLFDQKNAYLLLVVRPSLMEEVTRMLAGRKTEVFTADRDNRDRLPGVIVDLMKEQHSE
jgi:nucleoside-triphosphatase THEP1